MSGTIKTCPNCGAKISSDEKICPVCGARQLFFTNEEGKLKNIKPANLTAYG